MLSDQAQMCPNSASRVTSFNEQIRSLDGGCAGHQGVVIFRPLAGRFLGFHLENRKRYHLRKHPVGSRYERMKKYRRATLTIGDARRSMFSLFSRHGKHSLSLPPMTVKF